MDRVLYFVGDATQAKACRRGLEAVAPRLHPLRNPEQRLRLSYETSKLRAQAMLRSGGIDALVVDGRGHGHTAASTLLRELFEGQVAGPIARQRTWLVTEPELPGMNLAYEAGRLRLAGVIAASGTALWEEVWGTIVATTARSRSGKVAICLAGGGTEGLLYELGVLRAMQQFLPAYDLCNADLICGISAGAILGALLANGLGPETVSAGLRGRDERVDPISRADLFDLNVAGFASHATRLLGELVRGRRSPLSALFRLPPAGLFAGRRLERWLERQLSRPSMVNNFAELQQRLFIGATDQDSGEHVVFGARGAPNVPIHQAVRASIALAPFYAPKQIEGRYYIDGAFTRTTNTRVAVQQ